MLFSIDALLYYVNSKRHTCTEGGTVELLLVDQSLGEDEKVFKMVVMAA